MIADVNSTDVALFGILILVVFLAMFCVSMTTIWYNRRPDSLSPYSRLPLRRGSDLSYYAREKILRFLYFRHQYDNRIFDLNKAAICRETGRIFPNAINWMGKIVEDWGFLQKKYPGKYVSWGSLTTDQKEIVRDAHLTLKGFQTEFSSPTPQPKLIEAKYAFTKPGPLYVDIDTNVLLGWKIVPDTEFEVLIVQKPFEVIHLSIVPDS